MIRRLLTAFLTKLVRGYQLIVSPWFAPTCRYYPSCSQYAIDALKEHGPFRGAMLAGWRVLRCNPWSSGGVDHVVPREANFASTPNARRTESGAHSDSVKKSHSSIPGYTADQSRGVTQSAWRTLHGNL